MTERQSWMSDRVRLGRRSPNPEAQWEGTEFRGVGLAQTDLDSSSALAVHQLYAPGQVLHPLATSFFLSKAGKTPRCRVVLRMRVIESSTLPGTGLCPAFIISPKNSHIPKSRISGQGIRELQRSKGPQTSPVPSMLCVDARSQPHRKSFAQSSMAS